MNNIMMNIVKEWDLIPNKERCDDGC